MSFFKTAFRSRDEEKKANDAVTHEVISNHSSQSAVLKAEWDNSAKPKEFWKCKENKMLYERKAMSPNYYTMGYDMETGEKIKANCVESALYIAKKRAARQ